MKKSKSKKIALIVSGTIGLLAFTFLLFKELKIARFERALSELVDIRTDGRYRLVIGQAEFNLRTLTFHFLDIAVVKTDTARHTGGIESVRIPALEARFGSYASFMTSKKIILAELDFDEPIVEVNAEVDKRRERVTLGQTLVKIFPAVESILERFEVKSLRVRQGNLMVEKSGDELVHLRFIDLLVNDWISAPPNGNRQVELDIDGQELNLSKSSFSFSEFEYRYPQHYLIFKDFKFNSFDTTTSSRINVEGKSVLVKNLDYYELYTNKRYRLDKIEVIEPKFSGTLHSSVNSVQDRPYRLPLSKILKQAFGEIRLDSAIIRDASFQMTLALDEDSIKANIPRVNINLHNMEVLADSSDIQFGELQMDLSETELSLNDNVRLTCNEMFFERNEDFTISNVRLIETTHGQPFIECDQIGFKDFRFFEFVVRHELRAGEVSVINADVTLSPEYLDLLPAVSGGGTPAGAVKIGHVSLRNVNANYSDNDKQLHARGLSATAIDIRNLSVTSLLKTLSQLSADDMSFSSKSDSLQAHASGAHLTRSTAEFRALNLAYRSLTVSAERLTAALPSPLSSVADLRTWESMEFGKLAVRGRSIENNKSFAVGNLTIADLTAEVKLNGLEVGMNARDIHGTGIRTGEAFSFEGISARLQKVGINDSSFYLSLDSMLLDTKGKSRFYSTRITNQDLTVTIPYSAADQIKWSKVEKGSSRYFAFGPAVTEHGVVIARMDSLDMDTVAIAADRQPSIQNAVFYEPYFVIPASETADRNSKGKPFNKALFGMLSAFTMRGGKIDHGDEVITFAGMTSARLDAGINELQCAHAELEGRRNKIVVNNFRIRDEEMKVEAVSLEPRPQFFENAGDETDVIRGEWRNVIVTGVATDSLIQKKKIIGDKLVLNSFTMNVRRDRRLPDPPPVEKPFTVDELLDKGGLELNEIQIQDGFVRYTEISEKTGQEGNITLHNLKARIKKGDDKSSGLVLDATAKLYDDATIDVRYRTIDSTAFDLDIQVSPMDLTTLNQMILPLQSTEITSGQMTEFQVQAVATRDSARGEAMMSYDNLHVDLFKRTEPDKKNLGSEVKTFLADGIGLKHKKQQARTTVQQARVHEKSIFNYWVKIASQGALNVVRRGKRDRRKKRK